MWIASLTLLVYQCESRSINFTSIIKYYGLSRDVVTYDIYDFMIFIFHL